jgi:hypothetical protein
MIVHTLQNTKTGEFYSESQTLEDEALLTGKKWKHSSILPRYAQRYPRRKDALRRSHELSAQTGCTFAIVSINTGVPA